MVYDAFLFYNELDLLEIRFNILDSVVDKFVLVEANETFIGKPKPYYYELNKERFKKWEHKIIHYKVDDFPNDTALFEYSKRSPNVGAGEHWWVREFYQKESMMKALTCCQDNDIIFISDLDEIWNPNLTLVVDPDKVYKPIQLAYSYFLNNRISFNTGVGTRFGLFNTLKKYGINHFRTEREIQSIPILNGGWHFTFIGDSKKIAEKIENYGHQEYNHPFFKNRILNSIDDNYDFLNRGYTLWRDESDLPLYILENKSYYKHLWRN